MSTRAKKGHLAGQPQSASPVVRRAFSMQEADADLIEAIRVRCATLGLLMNQSEVVRVGLHSLSKMTNAELKESASNLERLTAPGRTKAKID